MNVYIAKNKKKYGPLPVEKLKEFVDRGSVVPSDPVLIDGTREWQNAGTVLKNLGASLEDLPLIFEDADGTSPSEQGGDGLVVPPPLPPSTTEGAVGSAGPPPLPKSGPVQEETPREQRAEEREGGDISEVPVREPSVRHPEGDSGPKSGSVVYSETLPTTDSPKIRPQADSPNEDVRAEDTGAEPAPTRASSPETVAAVGGGIASKALRVLNKVDDPMNVDVDLSPEAEKVLVLTGDPGVPFEPIDIVFVIAHQGAGVLARLLNRLAPSAFQSGGVDPYAAAMKAKQLLKKRCNDMGGDAVVWCQFQHRISVSVGAFGPRQNLEIMAYGTAVKLHG